MPGKLYWVSHYLQKGFKPEYLLSLSHSEKIFFIESMKRHQQEIVEYDRDKMKTLLESLGGK